MHRSIMVKQISLDAWSLQHLTDLLKKGSQIVAKIIISGGMIVPAIKQQLVFRLDEFPDRLLRKSKDLFLETVELLEKKIK